ncbi:MAG: hypothetical protein FWH21_10280 [Kiritimatiellaeota bacterium]|nr:hypothetical protein [Kiritimatiellota bacterium]
MNHENAIKTAIGFFVIVLIGSLIAAVVGGLFGALVAWISPEFVSSLFRQTAHPVRYAFTVGMIWGIFIGAAVSGFACFLAAVIKVFRFRFERKSGVPKED